MIGGSAFQDYNRRSAVIWGERSDMSGLEALQSVQFVTVKGRRLAILSAEDWEALLDWLEDLEDAQIGREALNQLRAAAGDRERAG
jgi:PHD/YefM family antitoxin component YafN of YafNO toxin-antitoxin module